MNPIKDEEREKIMEHVIQVNILHKKYKMVKKIMRLANSLHTMNQDLEEADFYFKTKQKEFESLFNKAESIKVELQILLDTEEKDLPLAKLKEHIKKKINKK